MSGVLLRKRWDGGGCPDCAIAYGHRESCPRAAKSGLPKYPDVRLGEVTSAHINVGTTTKDVRVIAPTFDLDHINLTDNEVDWR